MINKILWFIMFRHFPFIPGKPPPQEGFPNKEVMMKKSLSGEMQNPYVFNMHDFKMSSIISHPISGYELIISTV
jgi:hypothetical protein